MLENRNPSLQRSIGKFYSTHTTQTQAQPRPKVQNRQNPSEKQCNPMRSRSKSVGRIYSTGQSLAKQKYTSNTRDYAHPFPVQSVKKGSYSNMINYQQMQNKISGYLQSTMRLSSRQKYNYLSSHPSMQYQSHHLNGYLQMPQTQPLRELAQPSREQAQQPKQANQPLREQKFTNTMNNAHGWQKNQEKPLKNSRRKDSKQRLDTNKHANKQNMYFVGSSSKKENQLGLVALNHQEHKNQLESKLKKIINSYESKNKQLSMELHKIQSKNTSKPQQKPASKPIPTQQKTSKPQKAIQSQAPQVQAAPYKPQQLNSILEQLKQFNLKGANISKQAEQKLQQIWRSIHQQIVSDESLRIIKCFINQSNINQVFGILNQNRLKKIDISCLKAHQEEYDPFLIEKFHQLMKTSSPNLTHKSTCKWISDNFTKTYDLSEKNYLKNLNTQKFQCSIRALSVERQVGGLRRIQGSKRDLQIRDFTRSLSILFKANLRNRNVYLVFNKLKGMSYIGRFIELLDEKAGKSKTTAK